jgi:hypothetical protein
LLALERMARELPGKVRLPATPLGRLGDIRPLEKRPQGVVPREPLQVRRLIGEALRLLADKTTVKLREGLARAQRNWDQVDSSLVVLDANLVRELLQRRQRVLAALRPEADALRAECLLGLATLDAAEGLVLLFERRLGALIRHCRRQQADVFVDSEADEERPPAQGLVLRTGQAFLDLGSALREVARAWT